MSGGRSEEDSRVATEGHGWARMKMRVWASAALVLLGIAYLAARGWQQRDCVSGRRLTVSPGSETELKPLHVPDAEYLRWRDLADVTYSDEFCGSFAYDSDEYAQVTVSYEPTSETLRGRIEARGLKPWFAYQVKVVGAAGIKGMSETANSGSVGAWSSYQLGCLGRWWCEQCLWNLSDQEVRQHLRQGHTVKGYVLFDWIVTDGEGNCTHEFALDRSLHVLWRVGQRDRECNDSAPRWYELVRGGYGYAPEHEGTAERVGLYGEWEPDRRAIGLVRLPVGEYSVRLNLTEESFHANLNDEVEAGGLWAWVLDGALQFTVSEEERTQA